jgi:hypothetical protein
MHTWLISWLPNSFSIFVLFLRWCVGESHYVAQTGLELSSNGIAKVQQIRFFISSHWMRLPRCYHLHTLCLLFSQCSISQEVFPQRKKNVILSPNLASLLLREHFVELEVELVQGPRFSSYRFWPGLFVDIRRSGCILASFTNQKYGWF